MDADDGGIAFRVEVVEAMGFEAYAHGTVAGRPFVARLEASDATRVEPGADLRLTLPADEVHLFDPETERAL